MKKEVAQQVEELSQMLEEILDDRGVPRNIRNAVENAKKKILQENAGAAEFSAAIYDLDDISNDINMPYHTRTTLWEIISYIERVKEMLKK